MKKRLWIILFALLPCVAFAQQEKINSIGMKFVLIHPGKMVVGEFKPPYPVPDDTVKGNKHNYVMWMGDGRGYNAEEFRMAKTLAEKDSREGFEVVIGKGFYIGKFEVTQGQWKKVMGSNPSTFSTESNSDDFPVENVSWQDAQRFIRKLNKLEKTNRYRLPTEFEWEYAARAGEMKDIAWAQIEKMANLGKRTTLAVGTKQPNGWGLYDMLGNVWEWVDDFYNDKIFADPAPPKRGEHHVLKGGSFVGDVKNATYMTHAAGPANGWDVGFRILMVTEDK